MASKTCEHLSEVRDVEPITPDGCEECMAMGERWVHLRICKICGHVGCCDTSKNKHATKHFHETNHPIIAAYGTAERWGWCYIDKIMFERL